MTRRAGSSARTWAMLTACGVLAVGCGEGGAALTAATVTAAADMPNGRGPGVPPDAADIDGDPSAVHVQGAKLRSTPGGCEVDVTFRNVSLRTVSAGFQYDILDARGQPVASRGTSVQQATPGEVQTVSSEGTTAGPSGIPCPAAGRPRLADVLVLNV